MLSKDFFPFYPTLWLYHGLLRNKHNENIHETFFGVLNKYFLLRNQQAKYIFKRYITLKIVNPLKLSKDFFPFYPTLWLHHWLLRNKHNENIHEIPFLGFSIYIFSWKPTSKIYFQALYHLEDS
jgi:hypothetical protein